MRLTRDSLFWWFSIIGATAIGLAGAFDNFPWIPENYQRAISLFAFIYGIFAGKMATSPLPGEND